MFPAVIGYRRLTLQIKYGKTIALAILSLCLFIASGCSSAIADKDRRVQELTSILPVINQYRVEAYRHQDWCKNIVYRQGKYSNNNKTSTCNLFEGRANDFNDTATKDFQEIATELKKVGVGILFFDAKYDRQNRINYAEFEIDCGFCRNRFVYSPSYGKLPENMGTEMQYSRIDNDWYFVVEDWN